MRDFLSEREGKEVDGPDRGQQAQTLWSSLFKRARWIRKTIPGQTIKPKTMMPKTSGQLNAIANSPDLRVKQKQINNTETFF